jgi:hypothetical protein
MINKVEVNYKASNGCVTSIEAKPDQVPLDPRAHRLRLGYTLVKWELVPPKDAVEADWQIKVGQKDYENCPDKIDFGKNGKAKCNVKNKGVGERTWKYSIVASKADCATATLDPEIIFKKKGFLFLLFPTGLAWLVGVALVVLLFLTGRRRSAGRV